MSKDLPIQINKKIIDQPIEADRMQIFQQDPALKVLLAMLNIIPGGSIFSVGADAALALYNQIGIKRQVAFFEELRKDPYKLTEAVIQSEEFIHKFLITYRAVILTNRKEKIECFARLLKSSNVQRFSVGVDEYEEYLSILNDLSYQELQILLTVDEQLNLIPEPSETIEDGKSNPAWSEWQKKFYPELRSIIVNNIGVRRQELDDILIRLSRSGLYKQVAYISGENGNGRLTPLYYRIKELILVY